jgi:hypothetical protein
VVDGLFAAVPNRDGVAPLRLTLKPGNDVPVRLAPKPDGSIPAKPTSKPVNGAAVVLAPKLMDGALVKPALKLQDDVLGTVVPNPNKPDDCGVLMLSSLVNKKSKEFIHLLSKAFSLTGVS